MATLHFLSHRTFATLCCFYVVSAGAQIRPQPAGGELQRKLAQAEKLYTQHQFPQAESSFRQILQGAPKNFIANELLGLTLTAEGRDTDATAYLEKAVTLNPALVAAHKNLASNYVRRSMPTQAEKQLRAGATLAPHDFDTQHELGEFYASQGKLVEATVALKAAQIIRPDDYNNGYDLALAEMQTGKLAEAEAHINRLIQVRDMAELHSLLADVREKQGNFVSAAQEYQRAMQMEPSESAVFGWGVELLRHQNLKEAIEVFTTGAGQYPRSARLYAALGMTASLLGNSEAAVTAMLKALDLDPSDTKTYGFLSLFNSVPPSLFEEIKARFARYAETNPSNAQAQFYYANFLLKANPLLVPDGAEGKKVEGLLREAVRLDPTLPDAHLQLGVLDERRDDYAAAAKEFEAAIKYRPTLAVAHYRYGLILRRTGEKERARREIEEFRRLQTAQTITTPVQVFLLNSAAK